MTDGNGNDVPLKVPLPNPPFVGIGRQEHVLEYVAIEQLDAWRKKHGLVRTGTAFLGKPGWRPTWDGKMQFSGLGYVTVNDYPQEFSPEASHAT